MNAPLPAETEVAVSNEEWLNQRLANARLANHAIGQKNATLRAALQFIAELEPGSRGAYGKFKEAQDRAKEALKP